MKLKARYIDVDTGDVSVLMHDFDCAELGLREKDRVKVSHEGVTTVAIVTTSDTIIQKGEIGLLGATLKTIGSEDGELVDITAASKPESVEFIKKKMNGMELTTEEINTLIADISSRALSNIELSAYVTSLYIRGMNLRETVDLTKAMVAGGEVMTFSNGPIYDHHSIGGCPGNKITLLVVPIMAAAGCKMPKTSSRAISSAAGTSDIVETFANVALTPTELKTITEKVGGVLAWGGSLNLAPADDLIIKAEYPLGIDPHAQLLASVMAKKKAVGANFLVIDIPMGEGTKVLTMDEAKTYARDFIQLGEQLDIKVECAITYGGQPLGRAIGPALESIEAIRIMEGAKTPNSVIEKTLSICGMLFEMGGEYQGVEKARQILESGKALKKFQEIVAAQGGKPDITSADIKVGQHSVDVIANQSGYVGQILNKALVRVARTAGSPKDKGAGLVLNKKTGNKVDKGETIFTIYAEHDWKLQEALKMAVRLEPVKIQGMVLARVPAFSRVSL
ncbi:MAG: AMP phosphorylase [Methanomassiliicoccales archaeon]|nr:AMP phosphorylase [Methanomassiliicoccales archaeon]